MGSALDIGQIILKRTMVTSLTVLNKCDGERKIDDSKEGMPRQTMFDIPGTLHHVIVRGMEKSTVDSLMTEETRKTDVPRP